MTSFCQSENIIKTLLFNYYSKTIAFDFRIIIKQFKKISHKISKIGKTTFIASLEMKPDGKFIGQDLEH